MTRRARPLLALAACGVLAACAQASAPPPRGASQPPPTELDGIYRGTSTRYRADSRACPSPGLVVLRVVGGQFQYRWNGRTSVDAAVTPDGAVRGAMDQISLEGKMTGSRMDGDVSSENCAYHFRAVKRPD